MRIGRLGIIIVFAAVVIACACELFPAGYEELERVTSPDGVVDAVWVRGNAGATTGYWFRLFLVPKGLPFEKGATSFKEPEFQGDHIAGFKIVWKEPKLLELHYEHARISRYSNYWSYWNPNDTRSNSTYVVETVLVHTGDGSTLPESDRK